MFDWVKLALLFLQAANGIIAWARDSRSFQAGQDAQVAKAALGVLALTDAGKKIMERIDAMDDSQLGGLVDDLGRDAGQ